MTLNKFKSKIQNFNSNQRRKNRKMILNKK